MDSITRVAISNSNGFAGYLKDTYSWVKTNSNGDILSENLESLRTLNVENATLNSGDFNEIYNFSSLEKLIIKDSTIKDFVGLENAVLLTYVVIDNSHIDDYSGLAKIPNLGSLYFQNMSEEGFDTKFGNDFKSALCPSLYNFGIQYCKINELSGFNNMSQDVKNTIQYLYFDGNEATEISFIGTYNSVQEIYLRYTNNLENIILSIFPNATSFQMYQNYGLTSVTLESAPRLGRCDMGNTKIYDFGFLSNCSELRTVYVNNSKCRSLYFLENASKIQYVHAYYTEVGNGYDFNLVNDNYVSIGKSNENCLYALRNKQNLIYLHLGSCKYLGYVSYLNNLSQIEHLFLKGSDQILNEEFNIIKTFVVSITDKSLPVKFESEILLADLTSTRVIFTKRDFSVSDFENIANYSQVEVLSIPNGCRIMENGSEISVERYNTLVRDTLSGLSTLQHLSLGFNKLTNIEFIKDNNLPNLLSIDLTYTSVGTHIKDGNNYILNPNGIQLLNDNCSNLKCIKTSNATSGITDLFYAQAAISKCDDNTALVLNHNGDGTVANSYNGFIIWNDVVASTLSRCEDITYFYTREPQPKTLDFSKCKKIRHIECNYLNEEGAGKTIKLPDESLNTDEDGNVLGCEVVLFYVTPDFTISGKACSKLKIGSVAGDWTDYSSDTLWKCIKGTDGGLKELTLEYKKLSTISLEKTIWPRLKISEMKNYLKTTSLESISITGNNGAEYELQTLSDLNCYTNLKSVYFDKVKCSSLGDLTGLGNLISITITNTALTDISKLNTAPNVTEINFSNNSIGELSGLKTLDLTSINLNTNTIGNTALADTVNNVEILNGFKSNFTGDNAYNINNIDIRNNKFTDLSELSWIRLK